MSVKRYRVMIANGFTPIERTQQKVNILTFWLTPWTVWRSSLSQWSSPTFASEPIPVFGPFHIWTPMTICKKNKIYMIRSIFSIQHLNVGKRENGLVISFNDVNNSLSWWGKYLKHRMWYEPDRDHQRKEKDEFHNRHVSRFSSDNGSFSWLGCCLWVAWRRSCLFVVDRQEYLEARDMGCAVTMQGRLWLLVWMCIANN